MLTSLGIMHNPNNNKNKNREDRLNDDDDDDVDLTDYMTIANYINNIDDDSDNDSLNSLPSSAATLKKETLASDLLGDNEVGDDDDEEKYTSTAAATSLRDTNNTFNFRLCSVVTVPVSNVSQPTSHSPSSRTPGDTERVKLHKPPGSSRPGSDRKSSSRSCHHTKKSHRKKQKSPDYHRATLTSFGAIRRFDQQPPPPLSVLYSSLSDLLSPRPTILGMTDQTDAEMTKYRVVMPARSPPPTSPRFLVGQQTPGSLTPKLSIRRRLRQKTPDSAQTMSDVETCSTANSSSDDDAKFKMSSFDSNSNISGDEQGAVSRRNRDLMLHSGLRRPLERLLPSSATPASIRLNYSVPSETRISYDVSTNDRLNSLLQVRQLQTTLNNATSAITSTMVPSCSQTPASNNNNNNNNSNSNNSNILAHNIREMFLKHFGPPPVTVTSTGSKTRESIFPVEGSTVPVKPRPVSHTSSYLPPPRIRPKSTAMGQLTATKQVGKEENTNNNNNSSSLSNTNSSPLAGHQHSSTTYRGRGRGNEQGEDMGDAPDQPAGDGRRPAATRAPRPSVMSSQLPTYYLGSHNGAALVEAPLIQMGWKRITDKNSDQFRFKWCDIKAAINFAAFREGEQMVNHLPNNQLLTNKLGLLNSLQDYDRQLAQSKRRGALRLTSFYPETYRLDDRADRDAFLQTYKDGEIWICKPTGLNQGIGIHLVRTTEEAKALADDRENKMQQARGQVRQPMTRIVQRYILRPLLLDGRKFDIRCYMLIACTSPWLVLFHQGYIRLSIHHYHPDSPDITVHLTNQYIQKKDSTYKEVKDNTAWSMDTFNQWINDNLMESKGLERDWAYNTLTKQIQRIIVHIFTAVKTKLTAKVGFFELYGLDFMIDENMKIYLIEVNTNPSLSVNPKPLGDCIPGIVDESVRISIECFEKARKGQPLLPLKTPNTFNMVFHGQRKTIDFGPGENTAEAEDANESAWTARWLTPTPRSAKNTALDATLKQTLSAKQNAAFESKQALQRFQQQIITRGPSFNNNGTVTNPNPPNSARVQLKYSNTGHNMRSRTAVREFYTYAPSASDEESGVNVVNFSEEMMDTTSNIKLGSGARQLSSNNWERSVNNSTSGSLSANIRTYNWPSRDPAALQVKRRQEAAAVGFTGRSAWNSPPLTARSVKTAAGGVSDDSDDAMSPPEDTSYETARRSVTTVGQEPGDYAIFKPFRIVFVEDANNSPPPDRNNDRNSSVRRTRSLSPVKVNNQLAPPTTNATSTTRTLSPKIAPKPSIGAPVVTPRPRTVRQTLSTSVATVRVSNNNGDVVDDSSPPGGSPPSPSDPAAARYSFNSNPATTTMTANGGLQSANGLQRQVTFAPMSLPTVRLQLTQVQFPYPVIAGQTIASVPASALGNTTNAPVASSPFLTTSTRIKTKERKERGN